MKRNGNEQGGKLRTRGNTQRQADDKCWCITMPASTKYMDNLDASATSTCEDMCMQLYHAPSSERTTRTSVTKWWPVSSKSFTATSCMYS